MKERLRHKLLRGGESTVVTIALLTLAITGSSVFETLVADSCLGNLARMGGGYAQLTSPSEASAENMARGNRPISHKEMYLVLPLLRGDNSQSRSERPGDLCPGTLLAAMSLTRKSSLIASASLVSSALGRQFTLVGAKPSGTS